MTKPAVIDPAALNHLGAVVHKIRPQWDAAGIRSALESALVEHPYPDVAEMFVHTAKDATARTPRAAYERLQRGYSALPGDVPPTTPNLGTVEGRCKSCSLLVVRGEDHECGRIAGPDGRQRAFAAVQESDE